MHSFCSLPPSKHCKHRPTGGVAPVRLASCPRFPVRRTARGGGWPRDSGTPRALNKALPRYKKHGTIRAPGTPDPSPFFGMSSSASCHSRKVSSHR
jgi:hypothetical protein